MLRRTMKIVVSMLVAGGALAPAAWADNLFFSVGIDGHATVGVSFDDWTGTTTRVELVRGGAVVGTATGPGGAPLASLQAKTLQAGDVVNVYRGNVLVGALPYSGNPAIGADACAGREKFTVTRDADATLEGAGSYVPGSGGYSNWTRSIWSKGNPATVTIDSPLVLGGIAWAQTYRTTKWPSGRPLGVISQRDATVQACPVPEEPKILLPAPQPTPTPAPGPSPAPPTLQNRFKAGLSTTGNQLAKLDPAKVARKATLTLPVVFPQQGSLKLRLTAKAKGKTVTLGTGSKSAPAGTIKISVKLTKAGRKLLKGSKTLKVTYSATFTPTGTGAKAISEQGTATLKRAAKQAK